MRECVLSPEAVADLQAVWDFIAKDNESAADRMVDQILDAFDRLAQWPGLGHIRPDLTTRDVRFWGVESYLIVYRESHGVLHIVAILHGSRDIPTVLGAR